MSAAEDTARLLREGGHAVRAYTGRTDPEQREELERQLKDNELKALVATSALGMGFDKPDLGFVIHLGAPSSPVAYYQQVGRAGRATDNADVLLLPGREDAEIWHYFATSSMPSEERAAAVIGELSDKPLSTPALEALVNIRRTPLELLLKVLDVDGAVRRVQGGWVATGQPWTYDRERYERIAEARAAEQKSMIDYEHASTCRMEILQRDLDDPTAAPCGRCDNCAGPWFPDRRRRRRRPGRVEHARQGRRRDRAARPVADRCHAPGRRGQGQDRRGRTLRAGPRRCATDRPRLGRRAA